VRSVELAVEGAGRLDLEQGGVEIGQIGPGIATDDPEAVELLALFPRCRDVPAEVAVIVANLGFLGDLLRDHSGCLARGCCW